MQGAGPPEAAPAPTRSSAFQVDRSKSTTTAAAYAPSDAQTTHRHGLGDALTRAAHLLAPHRKKSTGPTPAPAPHSHPSTDSIAAASNGTAGAKGPGGPLSRTSTFRLRTPIVSSLATAPAAGGPQLRALESYNARNVAAALDPLNLQSRQTDDVWQQVCIRVLPLFNGEGIRGFIEDLNDLVLTHVQRTFLRCQSSRPAFAPTNPSLNMSSLVTGLITADLTDLIRIGLVTLSNKLSPPMTSTTRPISDDKLLARLNEIWLFFFTGVLPHLEGVFWVLRSDDRLRAAVGESEAGRTTGSDGSGTPYGAQGFADTRIDVRRIALIEFRDCIVHPEMDRLVQIFASFYPPPNTATSSNGQFGRPMEGFESRTSTRPPSVSQNYSDMNDSPHPSLAKNPYRRSRSPPPHSTFPPPDRPAPSQRHQSSPARLSPNPEYIPSFEPRSPGMRSASGGSQFRLPRRTASHSSTSGFPRPFEHPTMGGSDGSAAGGIGREDGMLAQTPAEAQALARRRQMIAILASLLTADDRQAEMDELVRLLRPVYNARYRRAPPNEDEEDQSRNHNGGGGHVEYEEEDSGARTFGERDVRRRSGTGTPPPVAAGADSSGALTSLTASPVMLSQELHDPVPDFNSHLSPFPVQPHQSGRTGVATLVDGTSSQISARQRSRTMNSLDEEQPDGHHYKVASRSPRLSDVQAHDAQDSRPQRHSIDVPASAAAAAAAGGPARIPSSTSLRSGKKTRRLSFRPWLGRSNSAASSSATSIDGGGASSLAAATEDGNGDSGAASLTPGTVEGDRLRRGLLRRNSSRRTSDLSSMVPQLGVGYGQLAEDPAADERERGGGGQPRHHRQGEC